MNEFLQMLAHLADRGARTTISVRLLLENGETLDLQANWIAAPAEQEGRS